jgi:hypothetical protein
MKNLVMALVATLAVAGCSGGNNAAQQAEIDRLKAETEKLRADAAQARQQAQIDAPDASRANALQGAQAELDAADAAVMRQQAAAKRGYAEGLERARQTKNYQPYPDNK